MILSKNEQKFLLYISRNDGIMQKHMIVMKHTILTAMIKKFVMLDVIFRIKVKGGYAVHLSEKGEKITNHISSIAGLLH